MAAFVVRRVLWTIPILWVVVTIVFFMMRSIGGDPFRRGPMLGLSSVGWVKYGDYQPESIRRNQRERYGLDLPWYQQYANYLRGVATLDFGPSLSYRYVRVNDLLKTLPPRRRESRSAELAPTAHHGVGPVARLPRHGHVRDREHLRRPGDRALLRRFGARARLHRGARADDDPRRPHHPRE